MTSQFDEGPFYIRLEGCGDVLRWIGGCTQPQWWLGNEPPANGNVWGRYEFSDQTVARDFIRFLQRTWPGPYTGARVCRIIPPVAEQIVDVTEVGP